MKLLMFPGQGSQYPGMAKDWFDNFPEAQRAFEEGSDGASLHLKKLIFDGTDNDIKQTEVTQPAILTASIAIWRALQTMSSFDEGAVFAGHSLGEYTALVAAGVLGLHEAAKLVRHRGLFMQEAPAGCMLALVFRPGSEGVRFAQELAHEASELAREFVGVANFNSPEQIVLAGTSLGIETAAKLAAEKKDYGVRKSVPLAVSAAFHSQLMEGAADKLAPELSHAKYLVQPGKRYIANVDAAVHGLDKSDGIATRLVDQISSPVRWVQSIQESLKLGCTEGVEIGPGTVLSGLAKRISFQDQSLTMRNVDRWEDYKNAPKL